MTFSHSVKTAFAGVRAHKSRSFLTILGIVIGITAIILVMSLGEGAKNLILNQIRGLGSQTIIVEPGKEPQGPSSFTELFTDSLKERDIVALKNPSNVQGLKELSPNVVAVSTIESKKETLRTNVLGTSPVIEKILDVYPSQGSFFTEDDVRQRANTAVIGSETRRKLFGLSDALGQAIKIKGKLFRIIGVLPQKGQVGLFNVDDMVAIPYTTAQKYIMGITHFNSFIIQAENEDIVPQVVRDIKLTLRENHNIHDPDKDDFHVMTQEQAVERVGTITGILTLLLGSVAAISLVVGGIGIMNIMLVSVSERTREIGLRKALGATNKDILAQFLLEAVILTGLGGIIGITLGAVFSYVASYALSKAVSLAWSFSFPLFGAFLSLSVSAFVGLVFGLYPARQASLKSPIEALRYE